MSFAAVNWATLINFKGDRCAKLVLIALAEPAAGKSRADMVQSGYPSYDTIKELAECSRKSAIEKVKKLVGLKLVTVEARKKADGSPSSNRYTLYLDRAPDWEAWAEIQAAGGEAASPEGEEITPGGEVKPGDQGGETDGAEVVKPTAGGGEAASPEPVTTNQGTTNQSLNQDAATPTGHAAPALPRCVVGIPMQGNHEQPPLYTVTADQVLDWTQAYPAVDVPQQLQAMRQWALAHPENRKVGTKGTLQFIIRWLTKAQNSAPAARKTGRQTASATPAATEPPKCTCVALRPETDAWRTQRASAAEGLPEDDRKELLGLQIVMVFDKLDLVRLWGASNAFWVSRLAKTYREKLLNAVVQATGQRVSKQARLVVKVNEACAVHPDKIQGVA